MMKHGLWTQNQESVKKAMKEQMSCLDAQNMNALELFMNSILKQRNGRKKPEIKMPKKPKLKTPNWILEGYDSEEEYNKKEGIKTKKKGGKTFKLRVCPKCQSDEVKVILGGEEGRGSKGWECKKCKWIGQSIEEKELTEDEFMKYLDKKGEPVN